MTTPQLNWVPMSIEQAQGRADRINPAPCRRLDPYQHKLEYRMARATGQTAAQAGLIRRVIAQGHRVETDLGWEITDARSDSGTLFVRVRGIWLEKVPYFVHP